MKRLIYFYILFILFVGMTGCGDNTDFSNLHILTEDEIAEMARQDSIKEAQKNKINADLILEYNAEIVILANGYDGIMVHIDTVKIAELFGITPTQLAHGIANMGTDKPYDDAPNISGFCIEGTTHADNMTNSNTNSYWGHWWDKDGNTTTWGDNARVFAEYNAEEGYFNVGQMPGKLEVGKNIKFIECLKYQDLRVAIVITAIPKGKEQINASIVSTQDLTVEMNPRSSYDSDPIGFDRAKVLSDLGIASLEDAQIIGVNADGTYAQETSANNGYWYDIEGFASSHGDNAGVYVEYYGLGDEVEEGDLDVLYVGQMPNKLEGGYTKTVKYGFLANNKIVMLNITVKIIAYQDPETPPTGEPTTDKALDVTIEKPWDNTFSNVQFDVKDILREAFKMTTYQIHKARISGDLKIYCGKVSEEDPKYTSDSPGYWLNAAGEVCSYGSESTVFCCLGSSETALYLYAGNHPESCVPNTTVTSKYIISCNGGLVTVNLTVKVGAKAE
ncbi:DUF4859 domain-containing protein [uncultured Bacteroides sp.]|uniref:DUF4859 domain-containing protein n=1 Tax=uncultured Bacteroides sp. TaxID=162156 RepID=UPI0025F11DCD|nr:DUF4859 domain-containing protein [uncultured Bacteroides sp.]